MFRLASLLFCGAIAIQAPAPAVPGVPTPVPAQSLEALRERMQGPSGSPGRIAAEIADEELFVFGDVEGAELRKAVASLLDYRLEPGTASGWRLRATAERRGRSARLRAEGARRGADRFRSRIALLRDVLDEKPGAAERLAAAYPHDLEFLRLPGMYGTAWGGAALLPTLPAAEQAVFFRLGAWMSPSLQNEQHPLVRTVRQVYPGNMGLSTTRDRTGRVVGTREISIYDAVDADLRVVLALYGNPEDPGIRGAFGNFADALPAPGAVSQAGLPPIRSNWRPSAVILPEGLPPTGNPDRAADERLDRPATLFGEAPPGELLSYPEVLAEIAAVSGLSVVADFFPSQLEYGIRPRDFADPAPLGETLDALAEVFRATWRREGDCLLFRHAQWYFEEEGRVSPQVVEAVRAQIAAQQGLDRDDLLLLAARLNRHQFRNLGFLIRDFGLVAQRHTSLWMFQSLTPEQRVAAQSPTGLPFRALTPPQQERFLAVAWTDRPQRLLEPLPVREEWRLALIPTGGQGGIGVSYVFGSGDHTAAVVPAFQPMENLRPARLSRHIRVEGATPRTGNPFARGLWTDRRRER
jgi:hypothetical protein